MKDMLWDMRGEGDFVECASCGKAITFEEAEPEEGGEWECVPCNERCNAAEKAALSREHP